MWVDKYRPQKFTELLGDERTNRDVLRWLKHWDHCVFGKASKATTTDPHKRPERRILMLTGPPGFGKTTLAHIASRQAGYNVIEINASDDRTGTVVQNKIQDALESQAVFQSRPSCIVIDEIDGVSGAGGETGFIKRLLGIVLADEKALASMSAVPGLNGFATRKSKKQKSNKSLLRPIIVICNDLYAPALRTLRPYCQVVYFKASGPASLVARLRTICLHEGLQADVRALHALCEVAEHDLRSCVNSLQFVRTRSRQFTLESVSQTLAQRDMARSPHAVVEAIFKLPDAKRERKKAAVVKTEVQRIVQIAELVQSTNEYGKIMDGLFAHYPQAPYHDSHFQKPLKALSWLAFYDFCERGVYERQHGELMAYMPWAASAMHHLFATHESPRTLERSKQAWQAREKTSANEDLFKTWIAVCQPSIRQCQNALIMKSELLSYAVRIIGSSRINPVNAHLVVKPAERKQLAKIVDAMLLLGLDYKQYRNDDGSYIYRLEPALTELLNYEDTTGTVVLKGEALLPSRYAVRQVIAQELAAERIRRQQEAL
ncbi:P-loop containing nucleoside triphosphate hydrolase protein, partial [Protomyces lactucae-debilis]